MTASHDHKNRTYTVIGVALALFLGALDQTIVSTALPRIVTRLGGLEYYTWVTTIYLLVSTLLVPFYGKLSDIMNRKTLQLWSVSVFLVGSALCGMAADMTQLIVFRALQGLGGAGLFALAFIVISDLYPPRERGKVGGVFGAVFGLSSVLGPLVGGFLTDNAGAWIAGVDGWRWVFYVNLPLGAVALWFLVTKMPRLHPHDKSRSLDLVSAGLMVLGFSPLILGLQLDKAQHPWFSPEVLGLLAGGVVFLGLWVVYSLYGSKHPILDLRLFKNRVFTTAAVASFFFGAAFLSILVFLPLYMVNVQGVSATGAGASILPLTLGIVVGAGVGGPVATKLGRYKAPLVVGALVVLAGGLVMTVLTSGTPYWLVLVAMVVAGIGFGPAQSLYSLAIQNAVPPAELGQATSFSQFSRQIGSTVGVALAGALFSAAITAAMTTQLGAGGTAHPVSASELRQGPQEIRAQVVRGFNTTADAVDSLFDLTGDEAKVGLERVLEDPNTPAELKTRLRDGTPAMQIEAAFDKLEGDLETIVKAGDRRALSALFASKEGNPLPDESRQGISAVLDLPPAGRLAALVDLRRHMESGKAQTIEASTLMAKAKVRAQLEAARDKVADQTVAKVSAAFARAIGPIWWFNVGLLVLLVLTTALIPSLPLRGRGDPGTGASG